MPWCPRASFWCTLGTLIAAFSLQAVNWEADKLVLENAVAELKAAAEEQAMARKQLVADKKTAQVGRQA